MVDIHTRKLELIERLLHLQHDEAISRVEEVMAEVERPIAGEADVPAMPTRSQEELAAGLENARADVRAGRTLTHEEMMARAQQWKAA